MGGNQEAEPKVEVDLKGEQVAGPKGRAISGLGNAEGANVEAKQSGDPPDPEEAEKCQMWRQNLSGYQTIGRQRSQKDCVVGVQHHRPVAR